MLDKENRGKAKTQRNMLILTREINSTRNNNENSILLCEPHGSRNIGDLKAFILFGT